jgi:hypothetical protein
MLPGKGSLKQSHKTDPVKGISTLKTAVIFGANASGKSNVIKAIDFGKALLLRGLNEEGTIQYQRFRLDATTVHANSRIEYEIQHKGKNYAYGFVFNSQQIVEEWLYEINSKSETKIFERNIQWKEQFDLEPLLKKNKKEIHSQFLTFIAKGTPDNQLFLREIRTRKVKDNVKDISDLLHVIDWFQNSLKIIFPQDKYNEGIKLELKGDSKLLEMYQQLLRYFDTGINGVDLVKIDIEKIGLPKKVLDELQSNLLSDTSEDTTVLISSPYNETFFLTKDNHSVSALKFKTKHKISGSDQIELFDTSDESDGTNRIIDFIPLILDLLKGDNVFIIDEMERSLHPNLMYDLLDLFLDKAEHINSQLIIASHESSILTQKLLRKDEIWFCVKDAEGASSLYSLEEYNIRFDKEVRKDYLLGRFKAIPKLGNRQMLSVLPN